jgi:Escherichia/Staphylococcus phage prohead protease
MTEMTSVVYPIEWRAVSTDERIVSGIAVPWNETSYLTPDPKGERFLPGSLTRTVKARGDRLKLFRGGREHQHDAAIARPISLDPRHADGLWIDWKIGRTPAGDAALAEVAEGLLDAFSVGFRAIRTGRGADGAREVAEAELLEVQLLPLGAYDGARVLEVRSPSARPVGLEDLDAWLREHPEPEVDRTPLPELHRWSGRRA